MNEQSSPAEVLDSDFSQNNQLSDYEYLLIKLNDIKDSIALFESNFLDKF